VLLDSIPIASRVKVPKEHGGGHEGWPDSQRSAGRQRPDVPDRMAERGRNAFLKWLLKPLACVPLSRWVKRMAILRPDIEKALDDLISNEEGRRFQGLAVVLAKQVWPDLIASERKKDLGADAVGGGKVLACSLTATLEKIKDDAANIKAHFKDAEKLIFATPRKVTNTAMEPWKGKLQKDLGLELVLMSREEIISALMEPKNAPLCRTHLHLQVESESTVGQLAGKAREATEQAIKTWSARLAGKPLIDLRAVKLNSSGAEANEIFQLGDIRQAVEKSRRIVLEAPAGRGKTTTIVQLAGQLSSGGCIVFVIDLPSWIQSGKDILSFIGGIPAFLARGLGAEHLAQLRETEHSFLLNGWNEIAESDSLRATVALRELDQNFPAAGIVVTTRTHHIVPPLPGALRLRLLLLNRSERTHYLRQRLGNEANKLRTLLDNDPVLDELTRTPLILSEVTSLFEQGASIPKTKMGVLAATIQLHEQAQEHCSHLSVAPLDGRAAEYLSALAENMTKHGAVTVQEERARAIVSSTGTRLRDSGQIAQVREPATVIGALCGHHLLERQEYTPPSFRFVHQQFQEFYVASLLKRRLMELVEKDDPKGIVEFTKKYVNEPAWEEPLRMIAEEVGIGDAASANSGSATKMGALLVRMAIKCDPVYAAELARFSGSSVWKHVGAEISKSLRSMYATPDQNYKDRALVGMLATGSPDFGDIVLPLLTSADQQVRLRTYRLWYDFHLSSLGNNWQQALKGWNEEIRAEFVSDLLQSRKAIRELAPFALCDSKLKVRVAAVTALCWTSSPEDRAQLLGELDNDTFNAAVLELPVEIVPASFRDRALAVYQKLYGETSDPVRRLGILLRLAELRDSVTEEIKNEMAKCAPGRVKELSDYWLKPLIDIIRRTDPKWVSCWVAAQIVEGHLWHEHWISLVTAIPDELKERLLSRLESENLQHRSTGVSVLAGCADSVMVQRVFAKICEMQRIMLSAPEQRHELESAVKRQLEGLFRLFPVNVAVAGLSEQLSGTPENIGLMVVADLFSTVARQNSDLRSELEAPLTELLRNYLVKGISVMLREEDFNGERKADLASALSRVGRPEDMPRLVELIRADIQRVRIGRAAKMRGERSRLADGGVMSYASWHVGAVTQLDQDDAGNVLLDLLNEPEYELACASALVHLASNAGIEAVYGIGFGFGNKLEYKQMWEARGHVLAGWFNEERRQRFAVALRNRIADLLKQTEGAVEAKLNMYNLRRLANALAIIDAQGSNGLVLQVLAMPRKLDSYPIVQGLKALLSGGVVLPSDQTFKLFDSIRDEVRDNLWNDQELELLVSALCVLPFVDEPSKGIQKMRETISTLKLVERHAYQLRDLATVLGHSRCDDAVTLLRELASDQINAQSLGESWINALAILDTEGARELLLSFVDPGILGLPFEVTFHREDVLAGRLVDLARSVKSVEQRLLNLCSTKLPAAKRALLSKVVGCLGTAEAALAGLNLIDDTASPSVLHDTWKQIEAAFVEHKPLEERADAYTLLPRSSNDVRVRLFEMSKDDKHRMKSALALLEQIEVWRLEYGRPNGEPRSLEVESESAWPTAPVHKLRPDAVHN
jgi:hypothetical protein